MVESEKISNKKESFLFRLLCITILINILIPKAGIKIAYNVPLTLGNILFGGTLIIWFFCKIKQNRIMCGKIGTFILFSILFFLMKYIIIGEFKEHIGYIIPLILYPLIYFVVIDLVDTEEKMRKIVKIITVCIFFVTSYAILQFLIGIENCAIPGITVNYSDYINYGKYWYMTKSNGIDVSISKIVSTYQNGNLFGVNVLLFYPLVYFNLKKNNNKKLTYISLILFISSVFLSLSRACWFGIVLFFAFCIAFQREKTKNSLCTKISIIFFSIVCCILVFIYSPSVINRFSNTNVSDWISMSGRTNGLKEVFNSINESNNPLIWIIGPEGIFNWKGLAYEILPLSVFVQTGIIGIILLYYCYFKSLSLCKNNKGDNIVKGLFYGMLIWLLVGLIECAYWLPPGALNVFLCVGLIVAYNNLLNKKNGEFNKK